MVKLGLVYIFFGLVAAQDIFYKCTKTDLDYEIRRFNTAIGVSPDLTYYNTSVLYDAIFTVFRQDIIKTCAARSAFAANLGYMYTDCVDPWTIESLVGGNLTIFHAVQYAQIWNRLEFACGGGFHIAIDDYACIYNATQQQKFTDCYQEFAKTTYNYTTFDHYCQTVKTYAACGYDSVKPFGCKNPLSPWYLCESLRFGVGKTCPGLRCFVNQ
ncbi:unnamed protein product, partial [Mesorhabditis spiculigera]